MRNATVDSVPRSFNRPNTLPPRRLNEVISPSTQTDPQRSMKPRIVSFSRDTEVGASVEESRGCTLSAGGA